jgi:hypothetical protein
VTSGSGQNDDAATLRRGSSPTAPSVVLQGTLLRGSVGLLLQSQTVRR